MGNGRCPPFHPTSAQPNRRPNRGSAAAPAEVENKSEQRRLLPQFAATNGRALTTRHVSRSQVCARLFGLAPATCTVMPGFVLASFTLPDVPAISVFALYGQMLLYMLISIALFTVADTFLK